MADKNTLRKMSQDVLVIPFTEADAEVLDRFCQKQVEGMTQEYLESLILSFLMRENDEELVEAFENFCKEEKFGKELSLEAIIPVLEEYIVVKTIESVESNDEGSLYSLLLKNALILAVKGNGYVAYPKAIADSFDIYHDYIDDERTFEEEDNGNELTRAVLNSTDDDLAETINNSENEVIKSIVYDAAIYRYKKIVEGLSIDPDNLIEAVYDMVEQLVENAPWIYIDKKPAETIKNILGTVCNTELSLGEVIDKLKDENDDSDYLPTSILLRLFSGDDEGIALSRETKFTAAELAVYQYYELLAETLSKEMNETEE